MSLRMAKPFGEDLLRHIKYSVHKATHGRVHDFHVEWADHKLVLRGRARTHYAKQLAQHATRSIMTHQLLENAIEVG